MTGPEVKRVMARLSLTQQQLAAELGVARNTVNRWANDLEPIPRMAQLAMTALLIRTKTEVAVGAKKMLKSHRRLMDKVSK